MVVATGNYGRLAFAYETSYGGSMETDSSGNVIYHDFGYGAKLTGANVNRNTRVLYNIGSPFGKRIVALQFEGTVGVDGVLTNDNLFDAIFGIDNSGSGGISVKIDSNSDGTVDTEVARIYIPKPKPKSFTIEYGFSGDDNVLVQLKGCLIRNASISARMNDVIRYKISCVYQKPVKSNPTSIDPVDPIEKAVPTFVGAELIIGKYDSSSGDVVPLVNNLLVQDFSISLDLGANIVYALGSAFARDMYRGRLAVSGSCTVLANTDDFLELAYSLGWKSSGVTEPTDTSTTNDSLLSYKGAVNSMLKEAVGSASTYEPTKIYDDEGSDGLVARMKLNIDDDGDGVADRYFDIAVGGLVINRISQDLEAGEMVVWSVDYTALLAGAMYKFG